VSRPEVTQAPDVRVEKDAMDAIVCDGEQERCEWCVLVVEDGGRKREGQVLQCNSLETHSTKHQI
jgi:hypothetical protein